MRTWRTSLDYRNEVCDGWVLNMASTNAWNIFRIGGLVRIYAPSRVFFVTISYWRQWLYYFGIENTRYSLLERRSLRRGSELLVILLRLFNALLLNNVYEDTICVTDDILVRISVKWCGRPIHLEPSTVRTLRNIQTLLDQTSMRISI